MSGPLGRLIAQLVVAGAAVFSRAFVQAYQQAVANAKGGKVAADTAKAVSRKGKMSVDQALQILNFEGTAATKLPEPSTVQERYLKYLEANDPAKGGSFYLQSKVFRAHEAIEKAREEAAKEKEENV